MEMHPPWYMVLGIPEFLYSFDYCPVGDFSSVL